MRSIKTHDVVRAALHCSVVVALAGCGGHVAVKPDGHSSRTEARSKTEAPEILDTRPSPEDAADSKAGRREPTLIVGNDRQINLPPVRPVTVSAGGEISLKFEQAPVTDVVHAVLGDLLNVSYSIHQPVAGDITLHTASPVPREQVLQIVETVLQANGVLLVQDAQGVYHVGRPEALKGVGNGPRQVGSLPSGHGTVIVPLQFIGAAEMADILKPVAPPEAFVRVDSLRNLLILAGRRNQIENWLEFVNIFDVDLLKGMSVGLFPLEHISVKEIEAALKLVGGSGGGGAAPAAPVTAPRAADGKGGQVAPEMQAIPLLGPLGGVVKVMTIERMNAVLVVTPRAHYLEQAREWIAKLDRPREGGNEPQLFVYPVQNGTAQHLASLLNAIFGGTTQQQGRVAGDSGVAPGLAGGSLGAGNQGLFGSNSTGYGSGMGQGFGAGLSGGLGGTGQQGAAISQVSFGGQVRVVADDYNNTLLIYAPKSEYTKIESALRRLDIAPTQVLIEASILEVTLTDETRFGVQWFLEGSLGAGWGGTALLTTGNSTSIARQAPGFSYSITNPAGAVRAIINALDQKSLVNVISTPSVMVLDNQTAAIQVGQQQPIRSTETVTDGGRISNSIQYKDTGVMLQVTPSVNAGGMVSMVIRQAVTDVGEDIDVATGQRAFNQRQVQSRVAVRSGETLVMGGLIRENSANGRQGVPLLHEVPILGSLFGTNRKSSNRTELLVMITPHVVRGDQDIRDLGSEIRSRMQGLKIVPGWQELDPMAPRGKDKLQQPD